MVSAGSYIKAIGCKVCWRGPSNVLLVVLFTVLFCSGSAWSQVSIDFNENGTPALLFRGKPVLAYGPSPQEILAYLPSGRGNDYRDWAAWAEKWGIRNVRSYPPSVIVEPPAENVFERASLDAGRFDLTRFNNGYFQELRRACQRFEDAGIILHLQLWQAVYWKKAWDRSYYNPANNVNPEIAQNAGPGEFCTTTNSLLLDHQISYVVRILEATADLKNVFYDIMNEIGNGTAANREWVEAIIQAVRRWERERGMKVLLTLNDEGGLRLGDFSIAHPQLDLIVKDVGRYDEHVEACRRSRKPTVSVRNIDYHYARKERLFFYGRNNLEINLDPELQVRGRKYWWRMYMAGVVAAAGYADSISTADKSWLLKLTYRILNIFDRPDLITFRKEASYRLNTVAETNFSHFRRFVDVAGHPRGLWPGSGVVSGHPVANSYCLQNDERAIIYLESPNGEAGHTYPASFANLQGLKLRDGSYNLLIYHPDTGEQSKDKFEICEGRGSISLPGFKDDLALLIE
jgi:hypothetical protein